MKSLSLLAPEKFSFEDIDIPTPKADEALVNVLACGVCGSDIHAMHGKQPYFNYPRRLGHELCVEILSAPQDSKLTVGDKCVVEPYFYCGECVACRAGKTNCCTNLSVLGIHSDGGHIPQMAIPTKYIHKANKLSKEQAALVEPLAIGAHAVDRAAITTDLPTVILGMGTIGIAAAFFARNAGANLVVVDIDENRLHFAENTLSLGKGMLAGDNLGEQLKQYFGQYPECIIDATGNKHSMEGSLKFIEHGGRIVFVGLYPGDFSFYSPFYHEREITLFASRAALSSDFEKVIDSISNGDFDPTPMITERLQFSELDTQLIEVGTKPGLIKALIEY